jgi:AcrR family transcriptional regulator
MDVAAIQEQDTRERLLLTAADLFRLKGYAQSTTRELAELLGLKKATLYHCVESKEDLLYEFCIEGLRRIDSAVAEVERVASSETRLKSVISKHVQSALGDRDLHAVMLIELRALTPTKLAAVIERRDAYEARIRRIVGLEQERQLLRSDMTPKYLTLALLSMLNWTIFWYRPSGPFSPGELGDFLAMQFLDGARQPDNGRTPSPSDVRTPATAPKRKKKVAAEDKVVALAARKARGPKGAASRTPRAK